MQVNFSKPQLPVTSQRTQVRSEATNVFQRDTLSIGDGLSRNPVSWTIAGAVPMLGAAANFASMVGAGLNDKNALSYTALGGVAANLAGTASLAGGLLTGNSTATNVGLSLLAGSALTAGVVSYSFLPK